MKFFKLFENWNGESVNEAQKKLTQFDQKLLDLSNGMVGAHSKATRFKNVSNSTPDQFEAFLKQHYKDVKSLPIGKGPGESGSSKYPGWSITDPDTKVTKVVNLASASSAQEKYEDPLVQELNDYFEDGDESKLSSQSKAIVAQLKKKNKDLTLFKADSKDSNENNFAKNSYDIIDIKKNKESKCGITQTIIRNLKKSEKSKKRRRRRTRRTRILPNNLKILNLKNNFKALAFFAGATIP